MTNFIRDNTALPADKTADVIPYNDPPTQWGKTDANAVFDALRDTQSYLRGAVDSATSITVPDLNLVNSASPSVGPELDWAGNRGRWFVGVDVANAPTSRDFVITGLRQDYSFPDGVTTSGSPTLTSASGGGFTTALIGAAISGPGIPNGTTIAGVGGTTTLTMSANATASASGVSVTITRGTVQDLGYWKHRGALSPTLGIGVTPPDGSARLQVSPSDDEPAMGGQRIRVGPSQTGKALTVHDSSPVDQWWIDAGFWQSGPAGVRVQADATATGRAVTFGDNTKITQYSIGLPTGSGNVLRLRYDTGPASIADFGTDGSSRFLGTLRGSAAVRFDSEIVPSALGSDQNDYNPTNLSLTYDLLLSASVANVNITSIAGPSSGRELYVYNVGGSNTITLKHQSASGTAANRIIGRSNADVVLNPGQGVLLRYSASQSRWIVRHAP